MTKEDQETIINCIWMIGILLLWYILEWYQEKAGMSCPICGEHGIPCGCGDEDEDFEDEVR